LATDRQTDEQMDNTDALNHSRCRDRRLTNISKGVVLYSSIGYHAFYTFCP